MGLFSTKPRGMTPAQEAAARRGPHIPDDDAVNAAIARAEARQAKPVTTTAQAPYETMTVKLDMGLKGGQRKLEKLVADGWEIVSERKKGALEWGTKTAYTLRRARA